jgi:hypothetical protein
MGRLGFTSSRADPDVWFRLSKRSTGEEYYKYVLLYVNNVLLISEKAEAVLRKEIGKDWVLKEESIGPPLKYLGGKLREITLNSGVKCWAFGSCQYVQAAVNNVVDHLQKKGNYGNYVPNCLRQKGTKLPTADQAKQGLLLPYNTPYPLSTGYPPEMDVTPELGEADALYYQTLVSILQLIVKLGQVDIDVEVSMMSPHLALAREGHLKELYHIFAYLKARTN